MRYWYPNRPLLQTRDFLERMDRERDPNWRAEPKLNGDRLVLIREDSGRWRFMNRQKKELAYRPPAGMLRVLDCMYLWNGEAQLDGELLHNHTKGVKNLIVLYDVYVVDGEQVRLPLGRRQEWLSGLTVVHAATGPDEVPLPTWFPRRNALPVVLSMEIEFDYRRRFEELTMLEEVEGLVFKRVDGMLDFNGVSSPDVAWQVKVRRESKSYKF